MKQDLGFDFVIRFRGNIKVIDINGKTKDAVDWVGVNVRAKALRNAQVTILLCEVSMVVCVKAPRKKQAWWIAASNSKIPAGIVDKISKFILDKDF